jgi:transposase-like protein
MYGSHYSPAQVSNISKQMIPKVEAYHQRKLSDKFFCIYLDATYIPLRRRTFLIVKLSILPLALSLMATRKLSTTALRPMKNIEVWTELLQSMKSRGLEQVELFLSDGVVGMKTALAKTYPQAHFPALLGSCHA